MKVKRVFLPRHFFLSFLEVNSSASTAYEGKSHSSIRCTVTLREKSEQFAVRDGPYVLFPSGPRFLFGIKYELWS